MKKVFRFLREIWDEFWEVIILIIVVLMLTSCSKDEPALEKDCSCNIVDEVVTNPFTGVRTLIGYNLCTNAEWGQTDWNGLYEVGDVICKIQ